MTHSKTRRAERNLIPNPLAAGLLTRTEDGELAIQLFAPVVGKPLVPVDLHRPVAPDLFDALHEVLRCGTGSLRDVVPTLQAVHCARLVDLGLLVRAERAPSWPLFRCAIARAARGWHRGRLPAEASAVLRDGSCFHDDPVVPLRDPATGLVLPYWRDARTGGRRPNEGAARAAPQPGNGWPSYVRVLRERFAAEGYVAIRDAIPREQVSALSRYFGAIVDNGLAAFHAREGRWIKHRDQVAELFHHAITPLIRSIVVEAIKPSYPFFAAYRRGARLAQHTDRMQCEYTVSMFLGATPTPHGELDWPLLLDPPARTPPRVRLRQRAGDMLIFKGREIPHGRPQLRAASRSLHLFFHFVPQGFAGTVD